MFNFVKNQPFLAFFEYLRILKQKSPILLGSGFFGILNTKSYFFFFLVAVFLAVFFFAFFFVAIVSSSVQIHVTTFMREIKKKCHFFLFFSCHKIRPNEGLLIV